MLSSKLVINHDNMTTTAAAASGKRHILDIYLEARLAVKVASPTQNQTQPNKHNQTNK